ncbi:MAG: DNA-binding transcriptional LysR family regulator [Flavobacteriales bacterium]|jgi:DNA-binding transcriptional LysR family regulator
MDIQLLKIFITINQEQSITRAAAKLHYVQSNVSARLAQLEEELNCSLFVRNPKGMLLTRQGQKLLPMAAKLIEQERLIFHSMRDQDHVESITFAAPEPFVLSHLAEPLNKWKNDQPDLIVQLKSAQNDEVKSFLKSQLVDIGVIADNSPPIDFHVIYEIPSELVLVGPKNFNALNKNQLSKLQAISFDSNSFFYKYLERILNDIGLSDKVIECIPSSEAIIQTCKLGISFSLLPRELVERHHCAADLNIKTLNTNAQFSYYKICQSAEAQSPLVRRMLKYLP